MLRGKCRKCKRRISIRYPIIELVSAGLWVIPILLGYPLPQAALSGLFTMILLVIAVVYFEGSIIPNSLVITLAIISIPGFALYVPPHWIDRLIGGFASGLLFYLFMLLSQKVLKKELIDVGEIKLAAAAGLILGWQHSALAIGLSAVATLLLTALMKLFIHKSGRKKQAPFTLLLPAAMLVSHYFGDRFIHWCLHTVLGLSAG